jgi:hypothetical protein
MLKKYMPSWMKGNIYGSCPDYYRDSVAAVWVIAKY